MAGKTAAEKLQDLYALGPKTDDYKKSRNIGSRKNPQIVQELDSNAYDAARQRFLAEHADEITGLRAQMGQETTKGGLETEAATQRAGYLKGPLHAMFSDYAAVPPFLGALTGYGLARVTTPRALPGATKLGRLGTMTGPLAEAALGPIVDAIAHRAQGDNPTARGQDVTSAVGNFGLGEAAGALTGGIYQAYGSSGQKVPGSVSPPPELPPVAPPPQPIGQKGDRNSAVVSEIAKRLSLSAKGSKKDVSAKVNPALLKANEDKIRELAAAIHAASPEAMGGVNPDGPYGKVRSKVIEIAKQAAASPNSVLKGLGIAAPLLGAAALAAGSTSPVKAENYGYKPGEDTLLPALSPAERALWGATSASNQILGAAKEHPEYLVPYLGEAAAARDVAKGVEAHPAWEHTPPLTLKNAKAVGQQYAEDAQAVRNLEHAKAEDQRQRAELFAQRPELAPPRERPPIKEETMFPGMAQKPPAEPYASGGKVSSPAHSRAMNAKLSAMQHELQRALTTAVKRLEGLDGKKGAERAAGKIHQEKEDLIEDIWGLHELAQKIVGGKLSIHPQISKKELIGLARQHASSSSSSS